MNIPSITLMFSYIFKSNTFSLYKIFSLNYLREKFMNKTM